MRNKEKRKNRHRKVREEIEEHQGEGKERKFW